MWVEDLKSCDWGCDPWVCGLCYGNPQPYLALAFCGWDASL